MVNRPGHSLAEMIVAMSVLGVGLGSIGGASVFAMRRTDEALLKEQAVVLAMATLDSLTALPAPGDGSLQMPGIQVRWVVQAGDDGGDIQLSTVATASPRWVHRFHARFLGPVPALPP